MKREDKDTPKLRCCGKCKKVSVVPTKCSVLSLSHAQSFYCSAICQMSAWKAHKPVCGCVSQKEQSLPSQMAIDKYLLETGRPIEPSAMPTSYAHLERMLQRS